MKNWNEVKEEFETDGSLRDIYVEGVNSSVWDSFISYLKGSSYKIEFFHGDEKLKLPESLSSIKKLQETDPTTVHIWVKEGIQINCHFFIDSEIELDLSPYDVQNEHAYLDLIVFLKWVASSLKRPVKLTQEGMQDNIILNVN